MSEERSQRFILRNPWDAEALWGILKCWQGQAESGAPLEVTVGVYAQKRSLPQNAKFHAICSDVAKSNVEWMGKPRTAAQWKLLFVSGHAIATNMKPELIAGLEGELINVRESTAKMGKKRAASLIAYVEAWCAEHGIVLYEEDESE